MVSIIRKAEFTTGLILLLFLASCVTLPKKYIELGSGSEVSADEVLKRIEPFPVVFVGEIHTRKRTHAVQLNVIRHLHEKGFKLIVAFELFPSVSQEMLDSWVEGRTGLEEFLQQYRHYVNLPYEYYGDILDYARQSRIPVRGINADTGLIRNVSMFGISRAPEEFLNRIKYIECADEGTYARTLGFSDGRDFHDTKMPFLCDGQRLRDSVMAFNLAEIRRAKPDHTIVVLLGVAHSMKIAVPKIFSGYSSDPYVVLSPGYIRAFATRGMDSRLADYIWH